MTKPIRNTHYISIDPGLVSGLAVAHLRPGDGSLDVMLSEWADMHAMCDHIRPWFEDNPVVVTERFIISQRTVQTKVYYDSLYFNGWLSIEYPGRVEQTAAQAKRFAPDRLLKHLDWHTATKDGHANDAARHLLYRTTKDRVPWVIKQLKEYGQ